MTDVEKALSIEDNFARYKHVKSILIKGNENVNPKVSICIPTYKRVNTLRETIDSCFEQVGFNDYVIIVSDNNPERNDETEKYIKSIDSDKLLYYKHEENITMFGNLNRIYELSKSEYTVCIHDDDLLFPHFLCICMDTLIKHPEIDMLYPQKETWYCGKEDKPIECLHSRIKIYKNSIIDCIFGNAYPPTGTIMRTKQFIKIGGFDFSSYPSNDYYFNAKAFRLLKTYTLCEKLYVYRFGVNTSLKIETILGFIHRDIPLLRYILNFNIIFRLIRQPIISHHYLYYKKYLMKQHPEFDISSLDSLLGEDIKCSNLSMCITQKLMSWYIRAKHLFYLKSATTFKK